MKTIKLPIGTAVGLVRLLRETSDAPSVAWQVRIHRKVEMAPDLGLVCTDGDRTILLLCRTEATQELKDRLYNNGVDPKDEYDVCVQRLRPDSALMSELQAVMPKEGITEYARVVSIRRTQASDLRKRPSKIARIVALLIAIPVVLWAGLEVYNRVVYPYFFAPCHGDYCELAYGPLRLIGIVPAGLLLFSVIGFIMYLTNAISSLYTS